MRALAIVLAPVLVLSTQAVGQVAKEAPETRSLDQLQAVLNKVQAEDYKGAAELIVKPVGIPNGDDVKPGSGDFASMDAGAFFARLATCKFKHIEMGPSVKENALRMVIMSWECPTSIQHSSASKPPLDVHFAIVSSGSGAEVWLYKERSEATNG